MKEKRSDEVSSARIRVPTESGKSISHWDFKNFFERPEKIEKDSSVLTDKHLEIILKGLANEEEDKVEKTVISGSANEDWLMERRDAQRTGCTGEAPELHNLELAWEKRLPGPIPEDTFAAAYDKVYVGAEDGKLRCFDARTGSRLGISSKIINSDDYFRYTLIRKNTVLTGQSDKIISFNATLDRKKLAQLESMEIWSYEYMIDEERIYYKAKENLNAFNYMNGRSWKFNLADMEPVLLFEDKLLCTTYDKAILTKADNGKRIWEHDYLGHYMSYCPDKKRIIARDNSCLSVFDYDRPNIRYSSEGAFLHWPVVIGDKIYQIEDDFGQKRIRMFDVAPFQEISHADVLVRERSSALSVSGDHLYMSTDDTVCCFNNQLDFEDAYVIDRGLITSAPLFYNGMLFLIQDEDKLCAYKHKYSR